MRVHTVTICRQLWARRQPARPTAAAGHRLPLELGWSPLKRILDMRLRRRQLITELAALKSSLSKLYERFNDRINKATNRRCRQTMFPSSHPRSWPSYGPRTCQSHRVTPVVAQCIFISNTAWSVRSGRHTDGHAISAGTYNDFWSFRLKMLINLRSRQPVFFPLRLPCQWKLLCPNKASRCKSLWWMVLNISI